MKCDSNSWSGFWVRRLDQNWDPYPRSQSHSRHWGPGLRENHTDRVKWMIKGYVNLKHKGVSMSLIDSTPHPVGICIKKDAVERCFMLSLYKPAGIMRCSFPWRPLLMFWSPTPTLSLWHPARESFQKVAGECAMASSMRVCKLLPQDPSVYLGVSENGVYPPSGSLTRTWRFTGDKPTPCNANFFVEAPNVETMTILYQLHGSKGL